MVDGSVNRGGAGGVNVPFDGIDVKEVFIEIFAEDGVTQDVYRVTLFRPPLDDNPALAAISVSGGTAALVLSGETTVWTTQRAPDGGFAPAVLFVMN